MNEKSCHNSCHFDCVYRIGNFDGKVDLVMGYTGMVKGTSDCELIKGNNDALSKLR